jgi:hypothetical protein
LRTQHALLSAQTLSGSDFLSSTEDETHERCSVVEELRSSWEAIRHAAKTMTFVEDYYPDVDVKDFYRHIMNTTRAIDSAKSLAKLSLETLSHGRYRFQTIMIAAH